MNVRPLRRAPLALALFLPLALASGCEIVDLDAFDPGPRGCAGEPGLGGTWTGELGAKTLSLELAVRCDTIPAPPFSAVYAWRVEGTWRHGELTGDARLRSSHSAVDFRGCRTVQDGCSFVLGGDEWRDRYLPGPDAWPLNSPVELRGVVEEGTHLTGWARGSWILRSDTTVVHGAYAGTPFTLFSVPRPASPSPSFP